MLYGGSQRGVLPYEIKFNFVQRCIILKNAQIRLLAFVFYNPIKNDIKIGTTKLMIKPKLIANGTT